MAQKFVVDRVDKKIEKRQTKKKKKKKGNSGEQHRLGSWRFMNNCFSVSKSENAKKSEENERKKIVLKKFLHFEW